VISLCTAGLILLSGLVPADTRTNFRVESIRFYGNTRSKTSVIQRELRVRAGAMTTVEALLEDRAWLLRQHLFHRIELEVLPGSADSLRHVVIILQEKGTLSSTPLFRYDNRFGLSGGVEATLDNHWGRRQRIKAAVQGGGEPWAGLSWTLPQASGLGRLGWRLNARHDRTPYNYPDAATHFSRRRNALTLGLSRQLHRVLTLSAAAGWHQTTVSRRGLTFSGESDESFWLGSAGLTLDTRDWPVYPRTGLFFETRFTAHQSNATDRFFDFQCNATVHRPLFGQNIVAIQAVLNHADRSLPRAYKQHLGGGDSVRGLKSGARAGDHIFHATVEYRIPMLYARHPLAGLHAGYAIVLFADAGTAWNHGVSMRHSDWVKSVGLGVHAIWDHYVLRAEYGYRGSGWGFLSAGTRVKF